MAKVREVLFDLMRELGMTQIFGNVGSTEELMLQNFPPDFEYILISRSPSRWSWQMLIRRIRASRYT